MTTRLVLGVLCGLALAWPAPAPAVGESTFEGGCTATAVRVAQPDSFPASFDPFRANPQFFPCRDDHAFVLRTSVTSGSLRVLTRTLSADTDVAPLDAPEELVYPNDQFRETIAVADARVEGVTIFAGANVIEARGLRASVQAICDPASLFPNPTASSAEVRLNGQTVGGPGQVDVPVPGVGTLRLNSLTFAFPFGTPHFSARALWLDTGGDDVVVAEAVMRDFYGPPC